MKYIVLTTLLALSGCKLSVSIGGEKPDAPKERYEWVNGPVVHPVTGKMCSVGYCKDEPFASGKSGCHSEQYRDNCPFKK